MVYIFYDLNFLYHCIVGVFFLINENDILGIKITTIS